MDSLLMGLILSQRATAHEARSALPDAPVVPHLATVPAIRRSRRAVSGALHRLGDVVAPRRPVGQAPAALR